ncbi:MAG: magnesium transporter [Caldiserica bacterium]|nr:magnesium transporter [Caldisericota bacterium]
MADRNGGTSVLDPQELAKRHPAEVAEILHELPEAEAVELLRELYKVHAAADSLEEMDPDEAAELLEGLPQREATAILSRMEPDDAVDVLEELPRDAVEEILGHLEALDREKAEVLRRLLRYPPDSAGGLMSPEYVALPADITVQEAIERLRRVAEEAETIYYVYVVDEGGRLLGVLSLRDLVFARPDTRIREIMRPEVVSLSPEMPADEVAQAFDKYGYLAFPVVDGEGRLLGIVTMDDILDTVILRDTEDMYKMANVPREERVDTPWPESLRLRLPWLYINLATAFLAASVVGAFEGVIAKISALAIFMPVVAGQGGNAGMQTVTIVTRGIALGEVPPGRGLGILAKEVLLGLLNGLAVGIVVGAVAYAWKHNPYLGLVAFLAMMGNMVIAGLVGASIPLGLRALGLDPALASSVILTTFTDTLGFFLLLGLGYLFRGVL